MYLVMLETNGNQRYIFSSPRLRESIGASFQLTRLASWTKEALGEPSVCHPTDPWVSRSSGKVIIMVDGESDAVSLIGRVTRRALAEAPGMDVSGVYVDMGGKKYVDAAALKEVHTKAAEYALSRPPALARFSQMPFLTRTKDSVLPAAPPLGIRDEATDDAGTAHSLPSRVKRYEARYAREGLLDKAKYLGGLWEQDKRLARDVTKLERLLQSETDGTDTLSKVAVVHIDGNGVGAIMRDLDMAMKKVPDGDFRKEVRCEPDDPDALRRFLLKVTERLEDNVIQAFVTAWRNVADWARQDAEATGREHTAIPVVPVILGGDDVTVITSGDYALPFATAYLKDYEQRTEEDQLLSHLSDDPNVQSGPMTAAAGVAVVGHSYPFHIAYDLAERLVTEAKKVGKASTPARSTISYHVLFDSTVLDATQILHAYDSFTTRPFLLWPDDAPPASAGESATSANGRSSWPEVCARVRRFKNLTAEDSQATDARFPKTRAARIRRLLSDAAQAALAGDVARGRELQGKAEAEWEDARSNVDARIDTLLGDIKGLFDLMELTDILPASYLDAIAPGENTSATPSTSEDHA